MTNKVKPFYIRITDDMTPQMVQDAFDKCVDAGVAPCDSINESQSRYAYPFEYNLRSYNLFGVDRELTTRVYSTRFCFGTNAQEITLDQLDEWLGLEVEQEWKNGDGCTFGSSDMSGVYIAYDKYNSGHVIYSCGEYFYVLDGDFQKPETPEQKAERERLEAAYDLYCNAQHAIDVIGYDSFGTFKSDKVQVKFWLSIIDKTSYRKQ